MAALIFVSTVILPQASSVSPLPACVPYVNMPDGDLPDMPATTPSAVECAQRCVANKDCVLYTWVGPKSSRANRCAQDNKNHGCCWLKSSEVGGKAPVVPIHT